MQGKGQEKTIYLLTLRQSICTQLLAMNALSLEPRLSGVRLASDAVNFYPTGHN
jgi:hypothetical protein